MADFIKECQIKHHTHPVIHTTQSRMASATSAIVFLKNILIENLITTQQTAMRAWFRPGCT